MDVTERRKRRPSKTPVERDVQPGPGYVADLAAVGPRARETYVTFVQRLVSIAVARKLWLDAARSCQGDIQLCCTLLNVPRTALWNSLRNVGLTVKMLSDPSM